MGTLANSLFRVTMGWIRTLSQEIWNTVSRADSETLISWIGTHWKMLALILCIAGLTVDLIVYLFRWQPYRVWRSFFMRRKRRKEEEAEEEPEEDLRETRARADRAAGAGSPASEDWPEPPEAADGEEFRPRPSSDWPEEPGRLQDAVPAERSGGRFRNVPEEVPAPEKEDFRTDSARREIPAEETYSRPRTASVRMEEPQDEEVYRPRTSYARREEPEDDGFYRPRTASARREVPMDSPYRRPVVREDRAEPEGTTERFEQAILPRRRRRVRELLSDSGTENYVPPDMLIDQREAYRRPVYPSSWGADEDK